MKKSKGLTFFLSFVPGVGHLYLGQMNRGLQMLIIFFGSIFFLEFLRLNALPFVIPVVWFYSLFDALQQHRLINEEQIVIDQPIISWEKLKLKKQWIGWGMIFLGIYLLFEKLSFYFFDWRFYDTFRSIIFALIFILVGWYMISGKSIFSKRIQKEVK